MCVGCIVCRAMDDIVHLGYSSQRPPIDVPIDLECDFPSGFEDDQPLTYFSHVPSRGGMRSKGRSNSERSTCVSSQSKAPLGHKVRGPNWSESKMFVLLDRIESNGMGVIIVKSLPLQSLCMEPLRGNWCWLVAQVWLISGRGTRTKLPTNGMDSSRITRS